MPDAKTYTGSCHCGEVRYEVTTDLTPVISCNCSICAKSGILWAFVPPQNFTLLKGGDRLVDYQFHKHAIHHLHCSRCGIESFARGDGPQGEEAIALNVRCLDGVDIAALKLTPFDGRSL
jgi:hypothetical protein